VFVVPNSGQIRVYATNSTQVGSYQIEVTDTLSNLEVFGSPTSTIDAALKIDPLSPPPTFVYKSSFLINLQV